MKNTKFKVNKDWKEFLYTLNKLDDKTYEVSWTSDDEYESILIPTEQVESLIENKHWIIQED